MPVIDALLAVVEKNGKSKLINRISVLEKCRKHREKSKIVVLLFN